VRLSRCEVRDHINYRKNDRWPSYRFCRALRPQKSPMRYICETFGVPRFSSFSTQLAQSGHASLSDGCPLSGDKAERSGGLKSALAASYQAIDLIAELGGDTMMARSIMMWERCIAR
jgi:hypothetical protein